MITVDNFIQNLQTILIPETAVEGDAIGMMIESTRPHVSSVMTCLEVTDEVLEEAITHSCDTIITFHPLIYTPLKRIQLSQRVGRCVIKAIQANIRILSVHTTFDAHPQGTNVHLANLFGLKVERYIQPNEHYPNYGMGVICMSEEPIFVQELISKVSMVCDTIVRHSTFLPKKRVQKIAIVAGSGISFLSDVRTAGVDCFITADIKYHSYFEAGDDIILIDPGHYEMEKFVASGLSTLLSSAIHPVEFRATTVVTNPTKWQQ